MASMASGRGIEIVVSDENDTKVSTVKPAKKSILHRIWTVLLDDRVSGRPDIERGLHQNPEEYRILKKFLNISFITIGMALLIAVFVVIIYTGIGE